MAKKKEEVRSRSIDPAANELLEYADAEGISTMFSRAEEIKACNIGAEGACCKVCFMGPCRFTGKDKEEKTGVCGATLATVAARNYIRSAAGGASAHADHGRGIAMTLLAVARGETHDYQIKDPKKLRVVAGYFDIGTEARRIASWPKRWPLLRCMILAGRMDIKHTCSVLPRSGRNSGRNSVSLMSP